MNNQIQKLQKHFSEQKLDALLISSAYNIGYLTNFFGFSKLEREGYLLVTNNNIYFFASGLNSGAVEKHIAQTRFETRRQTGFELKLITISPRSSLTKKALVRVIRKEKIKRLGFEKHSLSFAEYERLSNDLAVKLVPTEHLVENYRMIKTPDEIASIEKTCKLGDKAFEYVLTRVKPGITEQELALEIELFIRRHGAGISFSPIVAFGTNSSVPHHVTTDQRLMTNSWVLLDFGVKIDNYCSDMTRTIFFDKASREQKRMYKTVLESQKRAIEFINHKSSIVNQGIKAKDIDKVARLYIVNEGYPAIPHSLGHGIGLEVHEPPSLSVNSKAILKHGMVFSIEPGIYLPGTGGIRIEDIVVLESSGPRFLTKAQRELIEI